MTRKRRRTHNQSQSRKAPKSRPSLPKRVLQAVMSPSGLFWTFASLVIAGVGTYYQFKPKVSVEPDIPIKTDLTINVPFKVTNQSALPIYDVIQDWGVRDLAIKNGPEFKNFNLTMSKAPPVAKLESGESVSMPLWPFFIGEQQRSDIEAKVSYKTAILPFRRTQSFRFVTRLAEDGKFHWYHKAMSDK